MYCGYCGKNITENSAFCMFCGKEQNFSNTDFDINIMPEKQFVKSVTNNISGLIANTKKAISDYEHKENSIKKNYLILKGETIKKILSTTPIEQLNKVEKGLRLGSLNFMGINYVSQILKMSHNSLISYPGIGDSTATMIIDLISGGVDCGSEPVIQRLHRKKV